MKMSTVVALMAAGVFLAAQGAMADENLVPPKPDMLGVQNDAVASAAWKKIDQKADERDQYAQKAKAEGRAPESDPGYQSADRQLNYMNSDYISYINKVK